MEGIDFTSPNPKSEETAGFLMIFTISFPRTPRMADNVSSKEEVP